jgi:multimeric flavodoxin WrbA
MKVLLVNGSPNQKGCTYTALAEVAKVLEEEGIETEIFWIGKKPLGGCLACESCGKLGKCVLDDAVNVFHEKAKQADGFIFGTPVYFASAAGNLTAFLDRLFYSASRDVFRLKPGAAVVSARRAGTTAALDQIQKYFTISEMPVVSSRYWNMVHGLTPEDVLQDAVGLYTMRVLARNMAYFLRCREAAKKLGVELPQRETPAYTNFIR